MATGIVSFSEKWGRVGVCVGWGWGGAGGSGNG